MTVVLYLRSGREAQYDDVTEVVVNDELLDIITKRGVVGVPMDALDLWETIYDNDSDYVDG